MMKLVLIGNVGNAPEMKYTANGDAILRFNVASNSREKDAQDEYRDVTEWVRCTLFGKRAESLSQYIVKGTRVYVDGRLSARPWTDREGVVRSGLELMVGEIELVGSKPQDQQPVTQTATRQQTASTPVGYDDELGDLPF